MNHFIRMLVGVLLAGVSLASWAGVLSQATSFYVPDPYISFHYTGQSSLHFGASGVRISDNGLVFVVAAPGVVNDPGQYAGVGVGFEFQFYNNQWFSSAYLANDPGDPNAGAFFGTGLALSADGGEAFFGFDGPCATNTIGCPTTPATNFVHGYLFSSTTNPGFPIKGDGLFNIFYDDSPVSFNGSWTAFGSTAALSGNGHTLIVGAPLAAATYVPPPCAHCVPASTNSGVVTIYTYTEGGSGNPWVPTPIADPGVVVNGGPFDQFGANVALSADGTTAVISAYRNGSDTENDQSFGQPIAYVYKLGNDGIWSNVHVFENVAVPNVGGMLYYADSVNVPVIDASGDRVVAPNPGGLSQGVTVFTQAGEPGSWSSQTITLPNDDDEASVAISADGNTVAIGSVSNLIYLYTFTGSDWTLTRTINDPATLQAGQVDCFGQSGVAISADNETLVVPAGCAGVDGYSDVGLVYVFQSPADLSLAGVASPSAVYLGQQTTLSFNVTNNDVQVTAYNVVLTDTLPAGFTNILATPGVGASCSVSGQTVTCTLPSLAPGVTWSPSIAASVTTAGNYTDTASVNGNQPDPDTANNSASIDVSMAPPIANGAAFAVNADVTYNGNLSGNNPCNCGTLAYSVVQQPAHGTVTITDAHTGAFSYTPAAGYLGADSFTFQLANGFGTSAAATESVTVKDVPPTATGANVSTNVNQPLNGTLSATPGYAEQKLGYTVVTQPAHGSVTATPASGAFTYTPANGYIGTDSFIFTAGDGTVTSSPATVTVTVKDIPPTATSGSVTTQANQPVSGTLSATPGYAEQVLSFAVTTPPAHGTVTVTAATGAFIYTPALGFVGSDSFQFTAGDGSVSSGAATVNVTVQDIAPTANSDNVTTTVNQPVTGTLSATPGFTGQLLSYAVVMQPAHGHVTLAASSGPFTYTPDNGYVGSDSFTFAAGDGIALSATATVSITVNDVAPTANAGNVTTNSGQAVSGTLSATAGYSGQALQFAVVVQPSHGTVTVNAASGAFTYTPASGYSGSDSFMFTAGDSTLTSAAATESVTVKVAAGGGGGGGGGGFGLLGLGLLAGVLGLTRRRRRM